MSEILRIEHAFLQLGDKRLLDDFSLNISSGEWVCVTGESGCGKTSLLRAVLGFLPLTKGEVHVNGIALSAHTVEQIRKNVAYVPQDLFLPAEEVHEMFRTPFTLKSNRGKHLSKERIMKVWELLGLEESLMGMKTVELSGGQRQRILLSMAVLLDKPLLLLDEPTSALDADSVERVTGLLRCLTHEGKSVLTVSHHEQLMVACDKRIKL